MIAAVKMIRRNFEKVYLLMAGDGDEEKGVQAKTDKGIIALGRLEFADVIALLDTSDIFCLPSDSEGFSTSLLEAAACGCYIVTTERGGAKELILNDEYGMVMKDNRPETVLQALSSVLSQKNMRERAVEKTYQRLKDNFIWEKTAEKVEQIADR